MAEVKPCPPDKLRLAKARAKREGQKIFVLYNTERETHMVLSEQTYTALRYSGDQRYELVMVALPDKPHG